MSERLGRRAVDHFALRVEAGIMTGADENPILLAPVHGAGKMRAAAGENENVIRGFGLTQDVTTEVAGGPLPAVDLGNSEREGMELAHRNIFQFADCDRHSGLIFPQRRSDQIADSRDSNAKTDDAPYEAGRRFDEISAADLVRTRHAHLLDVLVTMCTKRIYSTLRCCF